MHKALNLVLIAISFLITSSCSNNTAQKSDVVLLDSISVDSFILKDSVSKHLQTIFYPDSSADTNLILREGNVSIFGIGNGDCRFSYDCVINLKNNALKSFKLLEDNMVDMILNNDSILIREVEINGRGNKEIIISYPLEGHHLYFGDVMGLGDEEEGGWSYNFRKVEIWEVDEMRLLFYITPYSETWSKQSKSDKDEFSFYLYDYNFTKDNSIILSNLKVRVKDKIVPSKSKKADVRMGTYRFVNDTFAWVGFEK